MRKQKPAHNRQKAAVAAAKAKPGAAKQPKTGVISAFTTDSLISEGEAVEWPPYSPQVARAELELLGQVLMRIYGLNLSGLDQDAAMAFVRQMARKERVATISGLQEKLLHNPVSYQRFAEALPPTPSSRNAEFYLKMRQDLVPFWRTYPSIRIWHAGCSSIRDIYFTAIILHEEGLAAKATIYATDSNPFLLKAAQEGAFAAAALLEYDGYYQEGGGKRSITDYLVNDGKSVFFKNWLRENIVFAQHNLATDSSFNEFNAIFCRAALNYSNSSLQERAHCVIYESLVILGILGLDERESIEASPYRDSFSPLDAKHRLYRKTC